jgi:hypothetical protein
LHVSAAVTEVVGVTVKVAFVVVSTFTFAESVVLAELFVPLEQELNKAAATKIVKICFINLVCMFY